MCARTLAAMTFAASLSLMSGSSYCEDRAPLASHPESEAAQAVGRARFDATPGVLKSTDPAYSQKATSSPQPAQSDIVSVDWAGADARFVKTSSLKSTDAAVPFDVFNCPVTVWRPWFSKNVIEPELGAMTPLPDADAIPTAVLAELNQLTAASHSAPSSVPTHETYVADLMSLVPASADWVEMRDEVLDLGPAPQQQHYLNELQALAPAAPTAAYRSVSASRTLVDEMPMPQTGQVYVIPPQEHCDVAGDESLVGLFRPLAEIDVQKGSTSPPARPQSDAAEDDIVLKLPVDESCVFLQTSAPGYYFTPTRYAVARPNRNTYAFCHGPLYFEDPNLERCGRGYGCLTTLHSAARFGWRAAILPYLTTAQPPCCKVRALPDCPTCHEFGHDAEYPEFSLTGAGVQAGVITSLIYIIP